LQQTKIGHLVALRCPKRDLQRAFLHRHGQ
jgi:hypothetical protein